jgi:hypothetical protein
MRICMFDHSSRVGSCGDCSRQMITYASYALWVLQPVALYSPRLSVGLTCADAN